MKAENSCQRSKAQAFPLRIEQQFRRFPYLFMHENAVPLFIDNSTCPGTTSYMSPSLATRHVLLVEDSDADAALVRASAADIIGIEITHVSNAILANHYLFGASPFEDCPKPDLVLLDLRMPPLDGQIVLQFMRESPKHCDTPVVVLTTSTLDHDRCRKLGADDYIIKPHEVTEWDTVILRIFRKFLPPLPKKSSSRGYFP